MSGVVSGVVHWAWSVSAGAIDAWPGAGCGEAAAADVECNT